MNISENWLREWINPNKSSYQLGEQLTMLGLEVDETAELGKGLAGFLVGEIVAIKKHPDADKLQICQVEMGQDAPETIVCGAPNARQGLKVVVAPVGVKLPSGMKIKKAKLRGQSSNGMLCSAKEIGLAQGNDGILELHPKAPVGQEITQYLNLPDTVYDLDLTPNRGDCLSLLGVARDVAVVNGQTIKRPNIQPVTAAIDARVGVQIQAAAQCPGYAARCVLDIDPHAQTPDWMAAKLRRSGVRPLHLPVDIANFVMLELGQPMHAFDYDKLQGDIQIRLAQAGEQIKVLDGHQVELDSDTLVIADDNGPVAIAGMLGGADTAVDANSSRIVFESACFNPQALAGRARVYKIHTDASHRFERGVDPQLYPQAMERATQLLIDLAGGKPGPVVIEQGEAIWPETRRIRLTQKHIQRLLGQAIAQDEVERILTALGMQINTVDGGWQVVPPSWRYDIEIEADLIEEIARVYGYDRLEPKKNAHVLPQTNLPRSQRSSEQVSEVLRQRGYSEAITYSFIDPKLQNTLLGEKPRIDLANPIAAQYSQMRETLLASLLPAWSYNKRRQFNTVRLYERGLRFYLDDAAEHGIAQVDTLAGIMDGDAFRQHWSEKARPVDFFDIKGDVEALLWVNGKVATFESTQHPALHPGRCAQVRVNDQPIGWVGQLTPELASTFKVKQLPYAFELDYAALTRVEPVRYQGISQQPKVERDLAVVVAEQVSADALISAASQACGDILRDVAIFDVFKSDKLGKDEKSVALRLIFQDQSRTLTDADVDANIDQVIDIFEQKLNAHIRGN